MKYSVFAQKVKDNFGESGSHSGNALESRN